LPTRFADFALRGATDSASGPSWLTFIAQAKDSLWSVDLFRCESILLRSHWALVVIDVFTRRIVGFGIAAKPSTVRRCADGLFETPVAA